VTCGTAHHGKTYIPSVAVLCWGQGAQAPKSCPGPPNDKLLNTGQLDTVVLLPVDVIRSTVILLSRCCLPNDEVPALPPLPNIFPRTAPACIPYVTLFYKDAYSWLVVYMWTLQETTRI